MATLVPVKNKAGEPTGCWRIVFTNAQRKRRELRTGRLSADDAKFWQKCVKRMLEAQKSGDVLDPVTKAWLSQLGPTVQARLEALGLVTVTESPELGAFLDRYITQRADTKPATRTVYGHTRRALLAFFGADRQLRSITRGDADEWRLYLITEARKQRKGTEVKKGLADNTVRRRCGIAKQFFNAALRKGLVDFNPFGDLVAAVKGNAARFAFITREDAAKVLAACPDAQWRLIFALSRFGGLRCPSEHLALKWGHVDWERGRLTVPQPKLEHLEGKATRMTPLFPELRQWLEDVAYLAKDANGGRLDPEAFIITRYRDADQNLRTTLEKIIKRAKVDQWPKLFQNLRSTRETELAEHYPLHVVTAWLGNSQLVAAKHYLQVTDEHFERAIAAQVSPDAASEPAQADGSPNSSGAKQEAQDRSEQGSAGDAGGADVDAQQGGATHFATRAMAQDGEVWASNESGGDECASKMPHNAALFSEVIIDGPEAWAMRDSNPRHPRCKRGALTN